MKRSWLVVLSLVCCLVASSASAIVINDIKGYYLGALGGYSQLEAGEFDESAISYGVYGGYYFSKNFAVETAYVMTDNYVDVGDVTADHFSFAAKFHHYFSNTYSMFIKAGAASTKVKSDADYDGVGWLWGAGLNMAFSNNINVRLAYEMLYTDLDTNGVDERVESDLGNVYLGIHYQF
ncbi:membrane protein [Shewanella colwelliana]|uniref:outer membrane protein n=1 Tax=Shewanella colwelliana TaxID=23 RepID=UPI001BB8BE42|nr:outer membrane beta-barrel protein [Shewanella colwelliana]GIU28968.1 membrane protein [Shewanella colwelliana]